MNKINLKNISSILLISASTLLFFSCKEVIDPSPSNCQNFEGGAKFNAGVTRAQTANKDAYDRGLAAGRQNFTYVNGVKAGKDKIYKETYDRVYAEIYKSVYKTSFDAGYADPKAVTQGVLDGKKDGASKGATDGTADGRTKASNEAKAVAEKNASAIANKNGSAEGKYYGNRDGQVAGSKQGAADGYNDGYSDGKYDGQMDCSNSKKTTSGYANAKIDNSRLIAECEGVGYNSTVDIDGNYKKGFNSGEVDHSEYNNGMQAGYADGETIANAKKTAESDATTKAKADGTKDGYNKKYQEYYQPAYKEAYAPVFAANSTKAYSDSYTKYYTDYFDSYYKSYYSKAYDSAYDSNYKASYYKGYYDEYGRAFYGYDTFYTEYFKSGYKAGYAAYVCTSGSIKISNNLMSNLRAKGTVPVDTSSKPNEFRSRDVTVYGTGPSKYVLYPMFTILERKTGNPSQQSSETQRILTFRREMALKSRNEILQIKLNDSLEMDRSKSGYQAASSQNPSDFNKMGTSEETESLRQQMSSPYKFYWEN